MSTMMKNIKKFKTQSLNTSINSTIDQAKSYLTKIKVLVNSGKQLVAQSKKLPTAIEIVQEFSVEVEDRVDKWRDKTEPNIQKIEALVKKIKEEEN